MLVFSPSPVVSVEVSLDGGVAASAVRASSLDRDGRSDHMWVLPWDPAAFNAGLHRIQVTATNEAGDRRSVQHDFSVDGTMAPFASAFGVWVIIGNLRDHVDGAAFLVALWTGGVVLLGTRVFMHYGIVKRRTDSRSAKEHAGRPGETNVRDATVRAWITKELQTASQQQYSSFWWASLQTFFPKRSLASVFFPYVALTHRHPLLFNLLTAFHAYLYIGPWFVGRIYNERWAAAFYWGIVTDE